MGERAVISINQGYLDSEGQPKSRGVVHFYTHWTGDSVCEILADGLQKCVDAGRIDDEAYASRIIFDTLTNPRRVVAPELQDHYDTTGYGIMITHAPADIGYPGPCVWYSTGSNEPVVLYNKNYWGEDHANELGDESTYTVMQFINKFRLSKEILDKDLTTAV